MGERVLCEPLKSCPGCGSGVLQLKSGKHRAFYGCSRFPACDYKRKATEQDSAAHRQDMDQSYRIREPVKAGDSCLICGHGVQQQRNGRNGLFLGCSRFRAGCRATSNISSQSTT
ncbi:topoisomerase DNA-binding C4 zinc finger domain-containing protein [Paraburkholderia sp. HD33-4]|uniref:topoisomerase DNA-binding C4 zinc finger domain-containing protein n=1 Tax=Paraburkholderia sp. HD33-4 TaxID=2883242 RepID=UPI003FA3B202